MLLPSGSNWEALLAAPLPCTLCNGMFSKHRLLTPGGSQPSHTVLQEDVEDLYAENLISAKRCQTVLNKAHKAGIKGLRKVAKSLLGKNHARTIVRRKLKNTKWPDQYWVEVRVWNKLARREEKQWVCIHLIHEILAVIWELGLKDVILSEDLLDRVGKDHMEWMRQSLDILELLGFGLHGDGVPCNYDRTESVDVISINLPGVGGGYKRMRIPLVTLPESSISHNTMDDLMEVFAWSMRHLLAGTWPVCRHDGTPWLKSDTRRAKKTGNLGFQACLVEVRSDWVFLSKTFHFPTHGFEDGVCWKCSCKRSQVHPQCPTQGCIFTHLYIYIHIYIYTFIMTSIYTSVPLFIYSCMCVLSAYTF